MYTNVCVVSSPLTGIICYQYILSGGGPGGGRSSGFGLKQQQRKTGKRMEEQRGKLTWRGRERTRNGTTGREGNGRKRNAREAMGKEGGKSQKTWRNRDGERNRKGNQENQSAHEQKRLKTNKANNSSREISILARSERSRRIKTRTASALKHTNTRAWFKEKKDRKIGKEEERTLTFLFHVHLFLRKSDVLGPSNCHCEENQRREATTRRETTTYIASEFAHASQSRREATRTASPISSSINVTNKQNIRARGTHPLPPRKPKPLPPGFRSTSKSPPR